MLTWFFLLEMCWESSNSLGFEPLFQDSSLEFEGAKLC
jgi:hypothetical protein